MDFNNTGAMKSPFSPRVRQSIAGRRPIGISSAKKNQSKFMQSTTEQTGDVIYKTPMTTLETYGQPLPVMVTEALTFGSGEVSVRISPCGWCWVVTGRRILAWPRSPPSQSDDDSPAPAGMLAARELTLPQTDLAHKADLVVLFYEDGAQMPSCIGVSPEGVVRYWACAAQEAVFVDVSAELAGQECDQLVGDGSLLALATTTCTLVLINPTVVDGRATVTCRTLRPPSGWLGGLGRRVSLLFFGSMPAPVDTKLVGVACVGGCVALVAGGGVLQVWRGAALHEHALGAAVGGAAVGGAGGAGGAGGEAGGAGGAGPLGAPLQLRAAPPHHLLLLLHAPHAQRSPELRYAIAHVSIEDPSAPRVTSLTPLRPWPLELREPPRFLPLHHTALVYTSHYIALVSMTVNSDKVDYIDVSSEGDRILGAELCHGVPLVFSKKHGVLALSSPDNLAPAPTMCESPLGSPCSSDMYEGNLSLYEIDPHEVSMVTSDACGKLKTAFLFHLRRDTAASRALVDELFPAPAATAPDVDAELDRTVLALAAEMLDDMPAGDPRWGRCAAGGEGGTRVALGSSAALHVAGQLADKQRAFTLFLAFLRAQRLWPRLGLVTPESGEGCVSTESVLGALAERLVVAVTLRRLHQGPDAQLIDAAVYQVRGEEGAVGAAVAAGALSASDACYRRVTRVRRVLRALCRPRLEPHRPHAALTVLATVLGEVHKCRAQWRAASGGTAGGGRGSDTVGDRELLLALVDLINKSLKSAAPKQGADAARAAVGEAAAALADLALLEAAPLAAPDTRHLYDKIRTDIIQPFVEEGQVERAAALADKFKDFNMLIHICLKTDDLDRLYGYMDKYADEGMPEVAFARLADSGGRGCGVLARLGGPGGTGGTGGTGGPRGALAGRARRWLAAAPGRAPLLALHQLATALHRPAAATLASLAAAETASLQRMTTMASLAKLCLVASDDVDSDSSDIWRKIETCLSLGEQHETLPRDIRVHNGLDSEDIRVLQPEELVQMYVDSESETLTEYDFKKALDLTDFIQDMELRDELRLKVWSGAARASRWAACGGLEPRAALRALTFFRLVDLVHLMGGDLELLLPPVEDILTAPSLAELVSDPRVHFLIKYGYECLGANSHHMDE